MASLSSRVVNKVAKTLKRRDAKEGGVSKAPAFTPPVLRRAVPDYREEE